MDGTAAGHANETSVDSCSYNNTLKELIVGGGWGSASSALATVEVMDIETHEWFRAENLPEPLFHASMTLCGDQVYILGGYDE